MLHKVEVIIVTHETLHLVKKLYTGFRKVYPDAHVCILDNHSTDGTVEWLNGLSEDKNLRTLLRAANMGHGPAMHEAIMSSSNQHEFALTIDSDCDVIAGGFIEAMLAKFDDDKVYATGWLRSVDRISGVSRDWFVTATPDAQFVPYVHPAFGMYKISIYKTLLPFFHHGAPCLDNMRVASERGYIVKEFPWSTYVTHLVGGTRRMYTGMGFGDWNPVQAPQAKRKPWDPTVKLPI